MKAELEGETSQQKPLDERGSRSRSVVRGGGALLLSQLTIAVAQIIYSGITSRKFSPDLFGAFSVAMSGAALVGLLLTSGVPTYVLAQRQWDPSRATAARLGTWVGGMLGSGLLLAAGPLWALVWNAGGDAAFFCAALAPYALLAGAASTELAILRREASGARDAIALASGTLVGVSAAIVTISVSGAKWSLAVSPCASAFTMLAMAIVLNPKRSGFARPRDVRNVAHYAANVSSQNIVFFAFTCAPPWAVSVAATSTDLGVYSRGSLLVTMAFYAISNSLIRALQPTYRHFDQGPRRTAAITDSVICGAALSFGLFFGMAVVSSPLTRMWLGPGWDAAAGVMALSAVGYGLYVPFALGANSLEVLGVFAVIRKTQAVMAAALLGWVALTFHTNSTYVAAATFIPLSMTAMLSLYIQADRLRAVDGGRVLRGVALQAAIASSTGLLAFGAVSFVGDVVGGPDHLVALLQFAAGASLYVMLCLGTYRWQPAVAILRLRFPDSVVWRRF